MLKDVADEPRGLSLEGWPYGLNYRVKGYSGGSDHVCFADQAFGIPSVMFGSADQFHHTSFDDSSRVDSTRLKRVAVVTGGAALTIANADKAASIELAAQTYSHANKRITGTTSRLISEMIAMEPKNAVKLGTSHIRGTAMLNEAGNREAKALMAAQRLSDTASTTIDGFIKQVKKLAETQKEVYKNLYEEIVAKAGISPVNQETEAVNETMKLIPKKTYEGPTKGIRADDIQNEEDKKWFSSNSRGTPLGRVTLELMNFADGKRSIYEIAIAVSLEYHNIEPIDVKRYLDIHEAAGKITYITSH